MSNSYGTEIEIMASFWPVDNTEKQIWAEYEQLLGTVFFMFSWPKKVQTKKLQ